MVENSQTKTTKKTVASECIKIKVTVIMIIFGTSNLSKVYLKKKHTYHYGHLKKPQIWIIGGSFLTQFNSFDDNIFFFFVCIYGAWNMTTIFQPIILWVPNIEFLIIVFFVCIFKNNSCHDNHVHHINVIILCHLYWSSICGVLRWITKFQNMLYFMDEFYSSQLAIYIYHNQQDKFKFNWNVCACVFCLCLVHSSNLSMWTKYGKLQFWIDQIYLRLGKSREMLVFFALK